MNFLKCLCLLVIGYLFIVGCSGNYGTLKYQTESESKATKRKLIENRSDYNIWLVYLTRYNPPRLTAIIFHAKNDKSKLMLEGIGRKVKVKDQEMWTEVVKENRTSDGELALTWSWDQVHSSTVVREIWGPDNQLYGFIVYQWVVMDRVELVNENTLKLKWRWPKAVGSPVA